MGKGLAVYAPQSGGGHGLLDSVTHGVGGFVGHLAGDVKDAAVGIFPGAKMLATHPIKAVEEIAHQEWSLYSPLFHGNIGAFAHNVYDHPLVPLLDAATVFSLGLGGAARVGQLSKASQASLLGKAAALRVPKTLTIKSAAGGLEHTKNLSTRPARRLVQEKMEPFLPNWYSEARYAKYDRIDMAHRVAAKNQMLTVALKAGQTLTDPVTAPRARAELGAGLYLNLHRHAHTLTPAQWDALPVETRQHLRLVKDPSLIDSRYERELAGMRRTEGRWDKHRAASAGQAHELPSLRKQLAEQNALLREMHDKGYRIAGGAKTKLKEPTERQLMEYTGGPLVEIQENVKRLTAQVEKARVAKTVHKRAVAELDKLKPARMDLEKRSFTEFFKRAGHSPEAFDAFVNNFARHATTRSVKQAAKTKDGMLRAVPLHDAHNLAHEMRNSNALVKYLWQKPTRLWKMALLGYTPRIITNNAVGNWILHAVREENPAVAARTTYDAIRFAHGKNVAESSLMHAVPFKQNHWMHRHFSNELGNVFKHSLEEQGLKSRAAQGLYPIVHKVADEPVRVAAIYAGLRHSPEVKALMKKHGLDFEKASARALRKHPELRQRVAEHARTVAGDYFTISGGGRAIRELVPFYLWDRHILKSTGNLLADNPGRVSVMQKLGEAGVQDNEKWLGDLPEFLHGVIPYGKTSKAGRHNVLLTTSLNPFATIGDLAGAGEALVTGGGVKPGASVLSQVNPIISGTAQFLTGQDPLTGARADHTGGLVTDVASQLAESVPFVRLFQESKGGEREISAKGNPLLYRHGPIEQITSLFGVPLRSVDLMTAGDLALQEAGGLKQRRSTRKPIFVQQQQ